MKGDACFYCRHAINRRPDMPGWAYDCALGIDNSTLNGGIEVALACPSCDVRQGFQIGGYYTHMWFTQDGDHCLEWHIASDGDFPTQDDQAAIQFHICDFEQLEYFIAFWREELQRRGWLTEQNDDNAATES